MVGATGVMTAVDGAKVANKSPKGKMAAKAWANCAKAEFEFFDWPFPYPLQMKS